MSVSRYEQETIITFNEAEGMANVYTFNNKLIRRMDELCEKHTQFSVIRRGIGWAEYSCPKKYVTIRSPRLISEEQRAEAAKRLSAYRNGGATHD